jgi:hypothetical protein
MTDRTPLPEQLDVIERMLARAKAEKDWHAIPALKATALTCETDARLDRHSLHPSAPADGAAVLHAS